jgi:hypothetical protein
LCAVNSCCCAVLPDLAARPTPAKVAVKETAVTTASPA